MDYLPGRLQPLIKGVQSNVGGCYEKLEDEIVKQVETIRTTGYSLLPDAEANRVRKFTDAAYFDFYRKMNELREKRTEENRSAFYAAAENLETNFNECAEKLKKNIGNKKYEMLVKGVEKNIKKPSASELHFPSVSQPSLSYSAALRAD